jgi:predicted component of type VI protein secretion system
MPYLHLDGETRPLPPGETVVGSGAMATWRVANQNLAARHFTIRVGEDGGVALCPFSSQHVVVIAGRQVAADGQDLGDGDMIAAGSAHFVFTREANGAHASAVEPPRSAVLLVERARRVHPIEGRALTIGRDRASAIVLRDAAVSRFHAEIRPEAGRHVLYSSGSGGTRVNGHRLGGPYVLEDGDVVEIGETSLRYALGPPPAGWTISRGDDAGDDELGRRATLGADVVRELLPDARPDVLRVGVAVILGIALLVALVVWIR